jgi:exopolysaccharide biosynthesis polyprenyl glycosylphosphotransferase
MLWKSLQIKVTLQIVDFLTLLLSIVTGYALWNFIEPYAPRFFGHPFGIGVLELECVVLSALVVIFRLDRIGAYSYTRFSRISAEMANGLQASLVFGFSLIVFGFLFRVRYFPRTLILITLFVSPILFVFQKVVLFKIAHIARGKARNKRKIVIVGAGETLERLVRILHHQFSWGCRIEAILGFEENEIGRKIHGLEVTGTLKDLRKILHSRVVEEVITTLPEKHMALVRRRIIRTCKEEGVQIRIVSDFLSEFKRGLRLDYVYGLPIVSVVYPQNDELKMAVKRFMDAVLSGALIFFLTPVLLTVAAAVYLTSKGPVLYRWNVVGWNKKPFTSWKFRTMVPEADQMKHELMHLNEMKGPVFKIKQDPRVTRLGKLLRRYSLDELPQLFSVLKGDMSLVGPRPAGPHELKRYENWHRRKLSIKPGITCLWQVSGRNDIDDFDEWVNMDLEYIDNWSIWLDVKILLKTVTAVVSGRGAS